MTADQLALADKPLVLATDLDGTFLGGSAVERSDFYAWIEARRALIGLVFVTGRDPDFITHLTRTTDVPRPDIVIGDVGTSIYAVAADHQLSPMPALEAEIAQAWGDAGARVAEALADAPGLTLQDTPFRHRLSYDMDPVSFDPSARTRIEAMGLDVLISDNRFFDVLPPGVSKGPTLERLVAHFRLRASRVLAAGDTLNDLSMLELDLPGVAVGNAEQGLLTALTSPQTYRAKGHGVAGIAEAINHFNFLSGTTEKQ